MASCLVPASPAVQMALEHLGELDKLQKEEDVPFGPEASHHLREIAAAITELEGCRRTVHEQLEVETIETSKLRHEMQIMRNNVTEEISAAVAAARDANAAQISQLQEELNSILQETESMERKQEVLETQNSVLFLEREQVKGDHEGVINRLNVQLSEKANKQILLNEAMNEVQGLKSKISRLEETSQELEKDLLQERLTFAQTKENLQRQVLQSVHNIQDQKKNNAKMRRELDAINSELLDKEDNVNQLKNHIVQLENNIAGLTASESQCKEQLENEINKYEDLDQQKNLFDREMVEVKEAFELEIQTLQEDILLVDSEMEEARVITGIHLECVSVLSDRFRSQRQEEDDAMAEHLSGSRRLEKSKLRLEECIASTAKHRMEIREMEEEIKQLHDTNIINEDLFQRNMEELSGQLNKEKKRIAKFQVEMEEQCQFLEDLKRDHEQHVREVNAKICSTKQRYDQLREEETKLQDHMFMGSLIERLKNKVVDAEERHRQLKISLREQIKQHMAEAEDLTRSRLEKEEELKEKEEMLEEVQAQFDKDQSRHQTLKKHTSELKSTKNHLELSTQDMEKHTHTLLQPKESMRGQLEALRVKQMELLSSQSAVMSSTEKSIYENGLMLEQVNMENSRLHLCMEQMKEDVVNGRKEKQRHVQEIIWLKEEVHSLFGTLLEAWEQDTLLTEECSERDRRLLEALRSLVMKIQGRISRLGNINTRLQQQLVGLSSLLARPTYTQKLY